MIKWECIPWTNDFLRIIHMENGKEKEKISIKLRFDTTLKKSERENTEAKKRKTIFPLIFHRWMRIKESMRNIKYSISYNIDLSMLLNVRYSWIIQFKLSSCFFFFYFWFHFQHHLHSHIFNLIEFKHTVIVLQMQRIESSVSVSVFGYR